MRPVLLFATLLLVMAAGGGATASAEPPSNPTRSKLATPTEGDSYDPGWWLVLAAEHVRGPSDKITLKAGRLTATQVSAQIRVKATVSEPVWFADNLYGATAWAHSGVLWHRVDTAKVDVHVKHHQPQAVLASAHG